MSEFVWFFGASGAGKASLIEEVATGKFNLANIGGKAIVCRESLEFGRQERLDTLEELLGSYALREGTVLIKGQNTDLAASGPPYAVNQTMPKVNQQVVYVYTKPELLSQRTARRVDDYWPNADHDFESETAFQIAGVEKLCETLSVQPIVVDNSETQPKVTDKTLSDLQV